MMRKKPWDVIKYPQRTQLKYQVFFYLTKQNKLRLYAPYACGFTFQYHTHIVTVKTFVTCASSAHSA